jgi:hypothetical protein
VVSSASATSRDVLLRLLDVIVLFVEVVDNRKTGPRRGSGRETWQGATVPLVGLLPLTSLLFL